MYVLNSTYIVGDTGFFRLQGIKVCGGGGQLRDFFCDRSANLELVVAIVIF